LVDTDALEEIRRLLRERGVKIGHAVSRMLVREAARMRAKANQE
jgi:hypothetical protein